VALLAWGAWAGVASAAEEHKQPEPPTSPLYPAPQGIVSGVVTLVIFAILVAVLGKYAWAPILTGLKGREEKIRKDIADAEAARLRAEATLREYNQQLAAAEARSQEILSKAKSDADALAAQIRTRGQQEAEESRERATREIEDAKNQAVREIHEHAATLATTVAEKIIRRSLNPDDYRQLVDEGVAELQEMRN
jgi:F-type H+-transporting ATPase subunit b